MKSVKKLAELSVLLAAAVLLGYVEALVPLPMPVPGIKLGLANAATLFILYRYGYKEALLVSLIRSFIVTMLMLNFSMLIYSAPAAFFSVTVMALVKRSRAFSIYGVSMAGAAAHVTVQICVAACLYDPEFTWPGLFFVYLPALLAASVPTGCINAFLSGSLIKCTHTSEAA
ncbi:MAG: Gx transporter family protein [Lachnospiraceae bacterium]|nr:Gx transporter family protein [Lachnospiraceae bacterium]